MELKPEDIRVDSYSTGDGKLYHMRVFHLPSGKSAGSRPEDIASLRTYFDVREVLFDRLKKSLDTDPRKADTSV